jgi:hypothetical protein
MAVHRHGHGYVLANLGRTWLKVGGISGTVTDVHFHAGSRTLFAATFGRSIFAATIGDDWAVFEKWVVAIR